VAIWNLLESRNIDNVILTGVHANMCVSGRPFGLRQMAKNGKHVVLMRDLTDTMFWSCALALCRSRAWRRAARGACGEAHLPHHHFGSVHRRAPFAFSDATAGKKRLQILLLGDSTTEASIPKKLAPDEPQLEDMLRIKLATESDLPPCDVYNEGQSGEFIRRLLDTRYDKAVKTKPQADHIFIRYGINDVAKRENFATNFPRIFASCSPVFARIIPRPC